MAEQATLKYQGSTKEAQRQLLGDWYDRLVHAEETRTPIAYSLVPGNVSELLRVMGFEVVFPEINALQCAMKKSAGPLILKAEDSGYSSDVCAYVKNDVGLFLNDNVSPMGKLPKPDLLVCNYVGCTTFVKWFEALASYYHVPLFMLDGPYLSHEGIYPYQLDYFVSQLKDLITVCSGISGVAYDEEKLRQVLAEARAAEDIWCDILQSSKNVPAPVDMFFDIVYFQGPIFLLRGTSQCLEFYQHAWLEVRERLEHGISPIGDERFRAVIEGPPPWPHFREFWELFKKWGVVFVASTYSKVGGLFDFGFRHDPARPLESIAEYALHCFPNFSMPQRVALLNRYVEDYNAECLIVHAAKSCRSYSMGMADTRDYFIHERKVPSLLIESDLADPRYFQRAQLRNRIDAFFEALEHRKLAHTAGRSL
ncbi:MAG: 2-hydroxyacyl-CoA dehydratase [Candidatus Tectomicrobia bacterium]|nr:2-hydroxyacyl-CoA dehydratase [Candidatus Tectomicrobia bacterium]